VRNGDNQMIPLSTLVTPVSTSAPTVLERYNLYRTAELGGNPGAGYSSGDAIAAMEEVAATALPPGYGFEWSGISRQEKESAGKAPVVFGLAIVFVFLFLAACTRAGRCRSPCCWPCRSGCSAPCSACG
jgi:multidrug efflux pump subunit AcrB